jgi:uncharacterized membrane protein
LRLVEDYNVKRSATLLFLMMGLLLFTPVVFPARAAPNVQATPRPTPTYKACHVCDEGLPQPVVRAVLFWMNGCSHCHEVLENVLPPLQEEYGAQFDVLLVEVGGMDDVNRLYEVAASYGIPRERVGVPFLIIGDQALVGSQQIPGELPGLIEYHLAQGGVDWPVIPLLDEFLTQATPAPQAASMPGAAVVRVSLFTTPDCQDCQLITAQALGPLEARYGEQLQVQRIDVVTAADVAYLYQVAAGYGLSSDEVDLPLLIIGERVLMVEEIPAQLPALVESSLAQGGVDFPSLPPRSDATASGTETPVEARSNGFPLAIFIMALMAVALVYSLAALALGKSFPLPEWADWFIPALIVIGIGVAAYLSYVETRAVEAVCGPVGDCNTVQQSRYAKLFGILPVGILGLLGYLGLLAAWLARRYAPRFEKPAAIGFWGMTFFGVLFSLYLTYLEPFVIRAVCLWCLSSAVVMMLLLLLGTPPAVLQFAISNEDE